MYSFRVGILGATGAVGQKFIRLLEGHPWFSISRLIASERSAGKAYRDAANWIEPTPIPSDVAEMVVSAADQTDGVDFVFSGLDSKVAPEIERRFAEAGVPVISNAKSYRMHDDVPLLIPELNPDHIKLIDRQTWADGGFIVTNPNCSTVGLACALKPLHDAFGVSAALVTTMQAISGAGYPGVPSLDILGNVVPFIGGEEDKVVTEPNKILGRLGDSGIEMAGINISASCNRVPVVNGHTEVVSVKLSAPASVDSVIEAFETFSSPLDDMNLPSAPHKLIHVFDDPRFPQPARHADLGGGQTVSIGRIRPCPVLDFKFVLLVHNTIRGAAGGALLNAELLAREGYLKP